MQIGNIMWEKRFVMQDSFKDYLAMIMREYSFNFDDIKNACETHMDKNIITSFLEQLHMTFNESQISKLMDELLRSTENHSYFEQPFMQNKLCTKIIESSDEWAKALWKNSKGIEHWINQDGADQVLETIFKRLQLLDSVEGKWKFGINLDCY